MFLEVFWAAMSKQVRRSVKPVGDKVFLDKNSDYDPDVDDLASIGSDTSSVSVQQGVQQHLPTETSVCAWM